MKAFSLGSRESQINFSGAEGRRNRIQNMQERDEILK